MSVETIDKAVIRKSKSSKVPDVPVAKTIQTDQPVQMDDDERKLDLQTKIAEAQRMLSEKHAGVKTQGETIADLYSGLPASEKVAKLEDELEAAKQELNTQALESQEIEGAKDVLAEAKVERNHWQAMLSLYLVQWAHRYSRRDVTVGDQRLEIIITAKLGKVVDELQAELPLWDVTE